MSTWGGGLCCKTFLHLFSLFFVGGIDGVCIRVYYIGVGNDKHTQRGCSMAMWTRTDMEYDGVSIVVKRFGQGFRVTCVSLDLTTKMDTNHVDIAIKGAAMILSTLTAVKYETVESELYGMIIR